MRQTGGRGQYGHVVINLEPAPGEGFDFVNKIKGGAIPTEFLPAVEAGIEEALQSGVKAGYPMVDVAVELIDGSSTTSTPRRWRSRSPARWRVQEAARRAKPVLLEPVMRGRGRHARGLPRRRDRRPVAAPRQGRGPGAARQRARGPGASSRSGEMFGYATDLRSSTQGRATFTMQFERYDEVPASIAEQITEGGAAEPVAAVS